MIASNTQNPTMHRTLCSIKSTLRAISKLEETIRGSYGVSLTEALCLCSAAGTSMEEGQGCAYGTDLAEEVGLSPSRLSRVLSALEKKGLIVRARNEADRRKYEIAPSAEGQMLLQRMRDDGIEIPAGLI